MCKLCGLKTEHCKLSGGSEGESSRVLAVTGSLAGPDPLLLCAYKKKVIGTLMSIKNYKKQILMQPIILLPPVYQRSLQEYNWLFK